MAESKRRAERLFRAPANGLDSAMRAETVCRRRIAIRNGKRTRDERARRSRDGWNNGVIALREETAPGAGANLHAGKRKTTGAPTPIAFISIAKCCAVFANRFIANV
jgi:hypothetical protein